MTDHNTKTRFRREIFFCVVCFLLVFPSTLAQEKVWQYQNIDGENVDADYNSADFYRDVDYSDPNLDWDRFDQSKVPADRIGEIAADKVDILKVSDKSKLTEDQLGAGDNLNKLKNWNELNEQALSGAVSKKTDKAVEIKGAGNGNIESNVLALDSAQFFQIDQNSITNGIGIRYDGEKLFFDHADSVTTDKSISSNVDFFSGFAAQFTIEKADSVNVGCIRFDNVTNSTITAISNGAEIRTSGKASLTDCSFAKSEFESLDNGSLSLDKDSISPHYSIERGILTCNGEKTKDRLEAQSFASVNYGSNCFECMSINPVGTYHYIDPMIEKDFAITIPKEGKENYRLCLKKSESQHFESYDGQVDFISKKIDLEGIANYKRYPLKEGKISDVLTREVYEGKSNVLATFSYSAPFTYLDLLSITNMGSAIGEDISLTSPSNYYSLAEEMINGDKKRTLWLDWKLSEENLKDPITSRYSSDNGLPPIDFSNRHAVQDNGLSRVEILEATNPKIEEMLR